MYLKFYFLARGEKESKRQQAAILKRNETTSPNIKVEAIIESGKLFF